MDPLTIFAGVKAGIAAGKEITSLAKDLGALFDAIDGAKKDHDKKKNSLFSSANEEALDTFVKRKQADDIENQLREIVIATRGFSAWQELIELRKEIRVRRKKEQEEKKKRREKLWENILLFGLITLLVVFTGGLALIVLLAYLGKI